MRYRPPELVFSGSRPIAADTLAELGVTLKAMTRQAWTVTLDDVPGEPTMHEAALATEEAARVAAWDHPMVRAARPSAERGGRTPRRGLPINACAMPKRCRMPPEKPARAFLRTL